VKGQYLRALAILGPNFMKDHYNRIFLLLWYSLKKKFVFIIPFSLNIRLKMYIGEKDDL